MDALRASHVAQELLEVAPPAQRREVRLFPGAPGAAPAAIDRAAQKLHRSISVSAQRDGLGTQRIDAVGGPAIRL